MKKNIFDVEKTIYLGFQILFAEYSSLFKGIEQGLPGFIQISYLLLDLKCKEHHNKFKGVISNL